MLDVANQCFYRMGTVGAGVKAEAIETFVSRAVAGEEKAYSIAFDMSAKA